MKRHRKKKLSGRGVGIIPVKNLIFNVHMKPPTAKFDGRRSKKDRIKKKTKATLQNQ